MMPSNVTVTFLLRRKRQLRGPAGRRQPASGRAGPIQRHRAELAGQQKR